MIALKPSLWTLVIMSAMAFSCKTQKTMDGSNVASANGADSTLSTDGSGDTAVLYLGGFTSCGYENGQNYPDNVNPISKPEGVAMATLSTWVSKMNQLHSRAHKVLLACYPLWTNFGSDLNGMLKSLGGAPRMNGTLSPSTLSNFIYYRQSFAGPTTPTQKQTLGDFIANIGTLLDQNNIKKVAIVGHSYGGYTAMQLAKTLVNGNQKARLTFLVTLDPISMNQCLPETLVQGVIANQGLPGCTNAPGMNMNDQTITQNDMRAIAAKVPWANLWQGVDKYLHSSSIDVPGVENQEVFYSKANPDGLANHLFFTFVDDKKNPRWPGIVNNLIEKTHLSLQSGR